jgi:hypothetical protein
VRTMLQSTFIGRAGEYWVAAHLLYRGYNAIPMAVDSGVDILAHKTTSLGESVIYQIQVKTTQNPIAKFTLSRQKIESYWEEMVNLIVVSWLPETEPQAVIFPPSVLYMMTSGGYNDPRAPLRFVKGNVHIGVIWDKSARIFVGNRQNEFTAMRNQFDRLEDTNTDVSSIPEYAQWSDRPRTLIQFCK